jgi:hypothetical protein
MPPLSLLAGQVRLPQTRLTDALLLGVVCMSSRICLPTEVALHFSTPRGNAKSCPRELVLVGVGGLSGSSSPLKWYRVAGVVLPNCPVA